MKILISTPLFPPEISYPAAFSKNFAKHLASCGYDVVVATFSDFPEQIEGLKVVHVKKSHNLFLRLIKFYYVMVRSVRGVDLVILKQAGFSSFLTLLAAKLFRVKVILQLKEDEVGVRIRNQKVSEKSFLIWRVRKLQQFIFKHVDFILFSDEEIKRKILSEYDLQNVNVGVLTHPEDGDILHYGDKEYLAEEQEKLDKDWEKYTEKFIELAK